MTPAELKAARLRLGFRSRRALAEEIGVPKQTVDSWESGRRPIPNLLVKLLDCLGFVVATARKRLTYAGLIHPQGS